MRIFTKQTISQSVHIQILCSWVSFKDYNKGYLGIEPCPSELVFESPVRSGFLTPQGLNRDRNRSTLFPEVKKTGLDRKKTTDCGFNRSLDWSRSAPVLTSLRPVLQQVFYNYEGVSIK